MLEGVTMCNVAVLEFFHNNTEPGEFLGKAVLEVGSRYVNGSVRPFIERFLKPRLYVGIDLEPGLFVDVVTPAEFMVNVFGVNRFDVVVSTELLEHVRNWRVVVNAMKLVLKPGGLIFIITRSRGFPYHAYPFDFWRYEVGDMARIFRDFEIITLMRDPMEPGVFLKARKPMNWRPADLFNIELYSMILGRRTRDIPSLDDMPILRRVTLTILNSRLASTMPGTLRRLLTRAVS
ncbi:methyltransferase domain-containing protein [Vulcanisaeta souniana]|uniref:Methyltransferase type 11 n=1 Tax=Vulcanisaeta souniana JCM 11219 TaxID=1293586 RepID=A0A830EHB6_9CREN|nr:methyltransferase domain-containing protein [Vulcanisaeta souniana]BDR91654.1 hypothetical protein Vsou_07470 [Vulcanisaeta souniana JCM 11219]GGI71600.1 hypothetical protein GCM10007112_05470 [Vulcanisaeta souniana JCM 11219]